MKRAGRLLRGMIGFVLLFNSAGAAHFKLAWQKPNDFESVSFDGLNSPIVKGDDRGNVYVAAVDGSDGGEVWTRRYDGAGFESVHDMVLDRRGDLLITGYDGGQVTVKYDAHGNRVWESHQPALGSGSKMALDHAGNIYLRGWYYDEETTSHTLMKLDWRGRRHWTREMATDFGWGYAFAVDRQGNTYLGAKLSILKFNSRGRRLLTIPIPHEATTMDVDRSGRLLVSTPVTTTKFIAR